MVSPGKPEPAEPLIVGYPDRRYAWFVVAVLIVASLIAFIDRQVVAIVVEPMKADLGVSDAEIGWLYGVFALFYHDQRVWAARRGPAVVRAQAVR